MWRRKYSNWFGDLKRTELDLYGVVHGPEEARSIAEGLKGLGQLKWLNLTNNNLGPEGARFTAEGVKGLGKLEWFSLAHNSLGPEGARFIAVGLKGLRKLRRLTLGNNDFGPEGARFIAEGLKGLGKLEMLSLDNNNLGPEGARFIVEGLKGLGKLEELNLSHNDLGPEGARFIVEGLKGLGKLEELDLSYIHLGPEGARFIAEGLGKLKRLNLQNNELGLGIWFLADGLALGVGGWELTSSLSSQSLDIDLSNNMLDFTCLPALLPIALLKVRVNVGVNFFDEGSQSVLRERGFEVPSQSVPSSREPPRMQEIKEWVGEFPGYQQQRRLYEARNSEGFRGMENGMQFGEDDFEGHVEVLGGDLSSFQLVLEEYLRVSTPESLSLVYTNIGALCLYTPERCNWMRLALRSLSISLI